MSVMTHVYNAKYFAMSCSNEDYMVSDEMKQYIQSGFAVHRNKTAPYDIKYALSDGREQLKKWQELLHMIH